ncbi:MAG: hypothetical protein WDW36_002704 [Sanguina aurantia]
MAPRSLTSRQVQQQQQQQQQQITTKHSLTTQLLPVAVTTARMTATQQTRHISIRRMVVMEMCSSCMSCVGGWSAGLECSLSELCRCPPLTGCAQQHRPAQSPDARRREFLHHVLFQSMNGDVHAAVEFVLEAEGELSRREAAWRAARQKASESAQVEQLALERNRKLVLDRFDLQKINRGVAGKKGGTGQALTWDAADKNDPKRTVRYREGQAVTSKGEKFIVEKLKEDWDGGSTGKVYTKGKRGKGFV